MKVLVVDDEKLIRDGISDMLRQHPRVDEVLAAADGFEGLQMMRTYAFDVVFSDIRMPEMSGLEMLAQAGKEHLPGRTFILTSYADFSYARQAINLNVKGYLLKPVEVDELYDAVDSAVTNPTEEIRPSAATMRAILSSEENPLERMQQMLPEQMVVDLAEQGYPKATAVCLILQLLLRCPETKNASLQTLESMELDEPIAMRLRQVAVEACSIGRTSPILKDSLVYLIENACSSQITLTSVAAAMHTNPSYISTLFSQSLGIPFVKMLRMLRVVQAQEMLLLEPERSVTEIAFACGFENLSNFFRVFKSITQMTPKQFQTGGEES